MATDAAPAPLIDVVDPDNFAHGVPHEMFTWLRKNAPVYRHSHPDTDGFWLLSRAEDVQLVSRNPQLFSSWQQGVFLEEDSVLPLDFIRESLLLKDPPDHTRLRRVISKRFTPRTVAELEPRIRALAGAVIDDVVERGSCDLAVDVARRLPLAMICELMGVPEADRDQVYDWANTFSAFDDPNYRGDMEDALIAFEESYIYAAEQADDRQENPRDDLFTALVQADADGEALSEIEVANFFQLLAVAGNETTKNTTSNGMLALIEHPDQLRRLVEDPGLIPNVVEEILRWSSVVNYFRRTVTEDLELHGNTLRQGDAVAVYYVSANRDETVFDDPFRFDVGRRFDQQFAFGGGGTHYCLGAALARLQLRVMFEVLVTRMPGVRLAGDVTRLRSNWMNGIESLPVEFTPGPRSAA